MGPQKMMSARPQTMKNSKTKKKGDEAGEKKNAGDANEGKV